MSRVSRERNSRLRESGLYEQTKLVLGNLFDNVTKLTSKIGVLSIPEYVFHTGYQSFKRNCVEIWKKWEESERISHILREMKSIEYPSNEQKSMSKMLAYLGLIESLGITMMNMVLLFLVANRKEIHTRGYPTKHVETLEELESVWDTGYKLKFLEYADIHIFKEKIINVNLRNNIAHLKFTIEKNRGIIRDRDNNEINIDEKITDFWEGIDTLKLVLEDIGFLNWIEDKVKATP